MRRLLVVLGGVIAIAAVIPFAALTPIPMAATAQDATPAAELETAAMSLARTDVRLVLPFGVDGLDADLTSSANVAGVCGFSSLMATGRPDAWDCLGDDDQIYDPCFENPYAPIDDPGELACIASPFAGDVILLALDEPLVREKETTADTIEDPWALPWGVELANGERCTLQSDIDVVLAGQPVHYACADGGLLLGEVDRRLPIWVVSYLANGATESTLAEIAVAWS